MVFILAILVLLSSIPRSHQFNSIANCLTFRLVQVKSVNPFELDYICEECQYEYVVSFDMQQCVHYSRLSQDFFRYCKILSSNGDCAEAINGLVLDQDQNLIEMKNFIDLNCAQYDLQQNICIFPRFPYTLVSGINTIVVQKNYCAIFQRDLLKCSQYFSVFGPSSLFFFYNFQNSEQLLPISDDANYICKQGFIYKQVGTIFGCSPISFDNCRVIGDFKCIECLDSFSLQDKGTSCIKITNCKVFHSYLSQNYCIECLQNYRLDSSGTCIEDTNQDPLCVQYSNNVLNPRCQLCKFSQNEIGKDCYQNQFEVDCVMYSPEYNVCIEYQDNENYYADLNFNVKVKRSNSINCLKKHPFSDQCLTFECKQGYRLLKPESLDTFFPFQFSLMNLLSENIVELITESASLPVDLAPMYSDSSFEYLSYTYLIVFKQNTQHFKQFTSLQFCIQNTIGSMDNCIQMNIMNDSCDQCNSSTQRTIDINNRSPYCSVITNLTPGCSIYDISQQCMIRDGTFQKSNSWKIIDCCYDYVYTYIHQRIDTSYVNVAYKTFSCCYRSNLYGKCMQKWTTSAYSCDYLTSTFTSLITCRNIQESFVETLDSFKCIDCTNSDSKYCSSCYENKCLKCYSEYGYTLDPVTKLCGIPGQQNNNPTNNPDKSSTSTNNSSSNGNDNKNEDSIGIIVSTIYLAIAISSIIAMIIIYRMINQSNQQVVSLLKKPDQETKPMIQIENLLSNQGLVDNNSREQRLDNLDQQQLNRSISVKVQIDQIKHLKTQIEKQDQDAAMDEIQITDDQNPVIRHQC